MNKVMISVAPVSAASTTYDPAQVAEDVYACYLQGAAMVHLHVRDAHGQLTPDLSLLAETVRLIRNRCDIIIEISTGGVSDLTIEERCTPCAPAYVEANSLNVGSVNLGKAVYQNPIDDVRYCVSEILSHGKCPEVEVFELGMIHTVAELAREYSFTYPILFALVFGHEGEMPATKAALRHMREYLYECFPADQVLWGYTQAHRTDWTMMSHAIDEGASTIRIGFEDSDYLDPETRVTSNAPLIEHAVALLHEKGMEPMTPAEARAMLHIPQVTV